MKQEVSSAVQAKYKAEAAGGEKSPQIESHVLHQPIQPLISPPTTNPYQFNAYTFIGLLKQK